MNQHKARDGWSTHAINVYLYLSNFSVLVKTSEQTQGANRCKTIRHVVDTTVILAASIRVNIRQGRLYSGGMIVETAGALPPPTLDRMIRQ
jgi:hypothetical protein